MAGPRKVYAAAFELQAVTKIAEQKLSATPIRRAKGTRPRGAC